MNEACMKMHVSFLLHVKYTISYRIVSYRIVSPFPFTSPPRSGPQIHLECLREPCNSPSGVRGRARPQKNFWCISRQERLYGGNNFCCFCADKISMKTEKRKHLTVILPNIRQPARYSGSGAIRLVCLVIFLKLS